VCELVCVSESVYETNFVCLVNSSTVLQQERGHCCLATLTCSKKRSGTILGNDRSGVSGFTELQCVCVRESVCVCVCVCVCVWCECECECV